MRRLVVPLLALLVLIFAAAAAHAIELRNEDTRAYTVRVSTGKTSQELRMAARSASIVVCVSTCHFRLRGGGQVKASGDDVISIRDQKLVRRVVVKAD
ncbi:MAG: hypothetical protein EP329_11285 [Deltaproteobacteria bacterium]|nr:MAG: hypothetical protein EP329_11285 [Deltaproteobacteria bacterium]